MKLKMVIVKNDADQLFRKTAYFMQTQLDLNSVTAIMDRTINSKYAHICYESARINGTNFSILQIPDCSLKEITENEILKQCQQHGTRIVCVSPNVISKIALEKRYLFFTTDFRSFITDYGGYFTNNPINGSLVVLDGILSDDKFTTDIENLSLNVAYGFAHDIVSSVNPITEKREKIFEITTINDPFYCIHYIPTPEFKEFYKSLKQYDGAIKIVNTKDELTRQLELKKYYIDSIHSILSLAAVEAEGSNCFKTPFKKMKEIDVISKIALDMVHKRIFDSVTPSEDNLSWMVRSMSLLNYLLNSNYEIPRQAA